MKKIVLSGLVFLFLFSCSAQLKNVKTDSVPAPGNSIIYGKLEQRYDLTGTPRVYGIPVYEYGIFMRNLADKKVYYLKATGKNPKYFSSFIPPGKFELWYLYNLDHKFPLAKITDNSPNVMEHLNRINAGYGAKTKTSTYNTAPPVNGFGVTMGVSRVTLDYSKIPYEKFVLEIKPGTVNYVGTWNFHIPDWTDDLEKMTYCIIFSNDKIPADAYFKQFVFDKEKAEINIPK